MNEKKGGQEQGLTCDIEKRKKERKNCTDSGG